MRILFLVAFLCIAFALEPYGKLLFQLLTFLLLAYIGYEIFMERSEGKGRILSDPCVLSSIVTFGIFFGISNFIFFGSTDYVFGGSFQDVNYVWMNRAMVLVGVSAVAMWTGYGSRVGKYGTSQLRESRFLTKFLRKSYHLRWPVIWLCLIVSIISRYVQISLGVFGYSSEIEQLYALAPYRQYLDIGASLGRVGLVGVSLAYFSGDHKSFYMKCTLLIFLLYEVAFGFLSGLKLQAIAPLIIVGICRYVIAGKIPIWNILASAIILYFAYMIIEPFRIMRYSDESFQTRNIVSTGSAMWDIATDPDRYSFGETDYFQSFVLRSGLTLEAARSIRFKEESGLPENAPKFLQNALISPVLAFVPRLIWQDKPFGDLGTWYGRVVHHSPVDLTAYSMSPVGYLFFAGGSIGVLVGFYIIGLFLRVSCYSFYNIGSGGMFVFLGMLGMFFWIDNDIAGTFTSVFRFLPLLIVSQRFLFVS
ncbi:MAG: hypothetical protein IH588_02225 [Anaerolineales bacterium]|nr:hypothetical protein [Anaerolineales bacterium]